MQTLKIGVLGAARIAPKALIQPASVLSSVSVTAVAARDRRRAERFAEKHQIETLFDDYAALISSPEIDVIYNPLPISQHAHWSIKALNAGKHVICEKPFAMNIEEAEAMLEASHSAGKRLFEAFHYRYHPAFETCLAWLRQGQIGKVQEIEAVFDASVSNRSNDIRYQVETGGGAMMDLGCYPLNWAMTVMGASPEQIAAEATLTPEGVDESLRAELTFPGGVKAKISTQMREGTPFRASMRIKGETGEIEFDNPLAPHNGGQLTLVSESGDRRTISENISPITTYTWQLDAFARAILFDTKVPTEGEMILHQQRALDQVYEAASLRHLRYLS